MRALADPRCPAAAGLAGARRPAGSLDDRSGASRIAFSAEQIGKLITGRIRLPGRARSCSIRSNLAAARIDIRMDMRRHDQQPRDVDDMLLGPGFPRCARNSPEARFASDSVTRGRRRPLRGAAASSPSATSRATSCCPSRCASRDGQAGGARAATLGIRSGSTTASAERMGGDRLCRQRGHDRHHGRRVAADEAAQPAGGWRSPLSRRGARPIRPVAGMARQLCRRACASTARSRSRTSIRRPTLPHVDPDDPTPVRASTSPSAPRMAAPRSGCASTAARCRPPTDGETLRFGPLIAGVAKLIAAQARPEPRSATLTLRPDSLGTEALFAFADGSFWRRHFNVRFTPTGADLIVWVFDANGTRARTWRGSAIAALAPSRRTRADIVRLRADDAAALLLLEDMGAPAGDAADREQRGEGLARDLQRLEQQRGVVLDVGVEPPAGLVLAQRRDRALLDLRGIGQPAGRLGQRRRPPPSARRRADRAPCRCDGRSPSGSCPWRRRRRTRPRRARPRRSRPACRAPAPARRHAAAP